MPGHGAEAKGVRMKTFVHIGVIIIFLSAVAAIPAFLGTAFRLVELGSPPVIVLDDGQLIGQMSLVNWVEAFVFLLFDLPFASVTTVLWSALNALALTAFLVLVTIESVKGIQKLQEKGVFGSDASFEPTLMILFAMFAFWPFTYDRILGPERQPGQEIAGSWTLALLFYSLAVVMLALTAEAIRPRRRPVKANNG